MTYQELAALLADAGAPKDKVKVLTTKAVKVPLWGGDEGLEREFNPKQHPIMDKGSYPDIVRDGVVERVTRISIDLQRLATKRMTELMCGKPIQRIYKAENDKQKEVAQWLEAVCKRNRIDSVNVERLNMLFAGCEVMTLWYAVESANNLYGRLGKKKYRCRNFSPMLGEKLYPLFDDFGDLLALSVGYSVQEGAKEVAYLDTYTAEEHITYKKGGNDWEEVVRERITLGKIPAIYVHRPTPIWEDASSIVYEMEWALSRNGNYLRQNSKPLFVVFADEMIDYGEEKSPNSEFRSVMQYPKGSQANYITWAQAVDNLKFYMEQLRSIFFTQLQLPDWSYEKMSLHPMSGEAMKQLLIDASLKVKDESGRWLEFFDREINVLKAFAKLEFGESYANDIDALQVDIQITPYQINNEGEIIKNLVQANGGEPIMSQRESVEMFGKSSDVERTLKEIREQKMTDLTQPNPFM